MPSRSNIAGLSSLELARLAIDQPSMSTPANNANAEGATSSAPEPSIRQLPVPSTPRDARIIALLLASMGVQSASEGVVRVLMEFAHRQ
jgi:hypothetical protein